MLCETLILTAAVVVLSITDVNGQKCNGGVECIALDSCEGLYSQLQRGNTPELTRLLRSLHCGFQNDQPMICCPTDLKYTATQANRGDFNNGGFSNGGFNNGGFNHGGFNNGGFGNGGFNNGGYDNGGFNNGGFNNRGSNNRGSSNLLPSTSECGIQNNDRIVGGVRTDIDEHPWMALLRYDKPYGWGFYCGGALISSRYVLTAAHCVKGAELPPNWRLTQVRLGEWNVSSTYDCIGDDCAPPVQDVPIQNIIAHVDYDPSDSNQHNDIALLRLSRNAKFTDFVKPICLPLTDEMKRSTYEGYVMEVAGWGKTETRSDSDVKLKVKVPVVSTYDCGRVFSRVSREITSTQLCAGGNSGQDSCRGDSGGPLMGRVPSADNWYIIGVVSYGPSPCGTPGWPGVYTRVATYVDWIISKLRP